MKRSSLEALYSTINVPVTPVRVIPDADQTLRHPIGGVAEVIDSPRVRDVMAVRAGNEAEKPTPRALSDDELYFYANLRREEQRKAAEESKWIVTENAVGVKTYTPRR